MSKKKSQPVKINSFESVERVAGEKANHETPKQGVKKPVSNNHTGSGKYSSSKSRKLQGNSYSSRYRL